MLILECTSVKESNWNQGDFESLQNQKHLILGLEIKAEELVENKVQILCPHLATKSIHKRLL